MQNQVPTPVRQYAPRPCGECGLDFVPTHGNQKLHESCKLARQANRDRKREAENPHRRRRPPRQPEVPRVTYAPDFLRALPELRRELARQGLGFSCGRDNDPREIGYGGRRRND